MCGLICSDYVTNENAEALWAAPRKEVVLQSHYQARYRMFRPMCLGNLSRWNRKFGIIEYLLHFNDSCPWSIARNMEERDLGKGTSQRCSSVEATKDSNKWCRGSWRVYHSFHNRIGFRKCNTYQANWWIINFGSRRAKRGVHLNVDSFITPWWWETSKRGAIHSTQTRISSSEW